MLFQSVGSQYTWKQALAHLFAIGGRRDRYNLEMALARRYKGHVTLFARGRTALAEAVWVATGGNGKVAVNAFTCYSVIEAVEKAGCTPVYVDIALNTLHYGGEQLQQVMQQEDIKAVIVQNTLGMPADITGIESVARRQGIPIIEDLAHAAGMRYTDGREVGTVGDYTMLSFGRDKLLDTINGGALVTRVPGKIASVRQPHSAPRFIDQLRDRIYPIMAVAVRGTHGIGLGKYILAVAYKLKLAIRSADGPLDRTRKLPAWQAKRALWRFEQLDSDLERRRQLVQLYRKALGGGATILPFALKAGSAPVRVPLISTERDAIIARLKQHGFFFEDIWYDKPVSPARLYGKVQFNEVAYPNAVIAAGSVYNVPTHQFVTAQHVQQIAAIITGNAGGNS